MRSRPEAGYELHSDNESEHADEEPEQLSSSHKQGATKKQVKKVEEDGRFVYFAAYPREKAAASALSGVVETFFKGSVRDVVATLIDDKKNKLSQEDLEHLQAIIDKAKEEGQ